MFAPFPVSSGLCSSVAKPSLLLGQELERVVARRQMVPCCRQAQATGYLTLTSGFPITGVGAGTDAGYLTLTTGFPVTGVGAVCSQECSGDIVRRWLLGRLSTKDPPPPGSSRASVCERCLVLPVSHPTGPLEQVA